MEVVGRDLLTSARFLQLALKMDGAEASYPHPAVGSSCRSRRVGGRGGGRAASGASPGEAAAGADLGGSSKYSNILSRPVIDQLLTN